MCVDVHPGKAAKGGILEVGVDERARDVALIGARLIEAGRVDVLKKDAAADARK